MVLHEPFMEAFGLFNCVIWGQLSYLFKLLPFRLGPRSPSTFLPLSNQLRCELWAPLGQRCR